MYRLRFTKSFKKKSESLIVDNRSLEGKINAVLHKLTINPFDKSLKTHKVDAKNYGKVYSSRITGDLRIIWNFVENEVHILILNIGGHSGKRKVYK